MVANGTVTIGNYSLNGNKIISDAKYDVLLRMPWHLHQNPGTDYNQRVMVVGAIDCLERPQ